MGERVVVGRATPVEPVDETVGGSAADGPPLEYGRGNRAGDTWRRARGSMLPLLEQLSTLVQTVVAALGGWRRITFALGLGMVLGGLGECLQDRWSGDGAFWMFTGGILIGLTVRVPINKSGN
jgi:hypothetical protein